MRRRTCLRSWLRDFVGPGEEEGRTHSHKHGSFQPLGPFPPKRVSHPKLDSVVGRNDSRGDAPNTPQMNKKLVNLSPAANYSNPFLLRRSLRGVQLEDVRGAAVCSRPTPCRTAQQRRTGRCSNDAGDGAATTHGRRSTRARRSNHARCSNHARTARHDVYVAARCGATCRRYKYMYLLCVGSTVTLYTKANLSDTRPLGRSASRYAVDPARPDCAA